MDDFPVSHVWAKEDQYVLDQMDLWLITGIYCRTRTVAETIYLDNLYYVIQEADMRCSAILG